ncbi:MAG: hypothetical protein LUH07_10235, partial [Lachnospiraceae bacterium]|nr:hypothetical protein [Lachnospiraceae bacterium]
MCDEWEGLYYQLKRFFSNPYGYILQGEVGRWDGIRRGGFVFKDFAKMWFSATKDCDYFELSEDEEGNFFIRCSHHDGDNFYEIRTLTKDGYDYDNWTYDYDDKRSSAEIHDLIMSSDKLSKSVNFTESIWN